MVLIYGVAQQIHIKAAVLSTSVSGILDEIYTAMRDKAAQTARSCLPNS